MKNKKYKVLMILIFSLSIFIGFLSKNKFSNNIDLDKQLEIPKKRVMEQTLSMMLETESGSGDYEMVTQSNWPTDGYTFNETLSKCENGGVLDWDDEKKLVTMTGGLSDKCYAYFDKVQLLADYIKNSIYTGTQGENGLYYHDGTLENGISDGSYRYAGASGDVDNYVCINSTETTCSDANLFRIIGVFGNQVKLIKATSIGDMAWNDSGTNTWSSASLNTYLNYDYLSALGNFAENYIATTTWKVGGDTYDKIYYNVTPITAYTNEITSPAAATTVSKKIGLMYVSDYYYAASQTYWSKVGYSTSGSSYDYRAATGSNWLYLGSYEWTITPRFDDSSAAYYVYSDGIVSGFYRSVTVSSAVRPVFYLNSSVTYKSGSGTSNIPIRIV